MRLAPNEAQRLFLLTLVIGAFCGLIAVLFHEAIRLSEQTVLSLIVPGGTHRWIAWAILLPTLGALIAGSLIMKFPDARGSGIPQVKISYAGLGSRVRLRDAVVKFILATIQIGSGASLGREGPTVQICAGVATSLGRLARVSPEARRRLIPVGAAAGIAAAFNAPIAAVTFTIEEIIGKLDGTLLSGVIVAAALAAVIERSILGEHPVFDVAIAHGLEDARSLFVYALLGVTAALVSVLFTNLLLRLRARFRAMTRVPKWIQPAMGGLAAGVVAVSSLLLVRTSGVAGGGYESLGRALSGGLGVKVMLVLGVGKLVATCFSYSSGGVGGIFAPVLFIGAMLGGTFGWIDSQLFHHASLGSFALVGMGALFSSTIRAPITSILIIIEMTSGYGLILPLMIANMSAYVIARRFRRETVYEALLSQDGVKLPEHHFAEAIDGFPLRDLVAFDRNWTSFRTDSATDELLYLAAVPSPQSVFPVLDDAGHVTGLITPVELFTFFATAPASRPQRVQELMRPPVTVRITDSFRAALEAMRNERLHELPVVSDKERFVGFIEEGALARVYLGREDGPPKDPEPASNLPPAEALA